MSERPGTIGPLAREARAAQDPTQDAETFSASCDSYWADKPYREPHDR